MTTTTEQLLLLLPAAYLIGSVPFGLMVGLAGESTRAAGSGNIGATNVGRLLGKRFFFAVFLLDMAKGLLPALAASWVVARAPADGGGPTWVVYLLWLGVGFATICGHMFSVLLKFKGGKGVATSAGVIFGVWPYFTLAAVGVMLAWGVTFALTRIISLSSMVASVFFTVAYVAIGLWRGWPVAGNRWPLLVFAVLVPGMIVWKHRGNIARIRAGTEPRVGAE